MNPAQVLILPGWQNSGPEHWQSRWQQRYGYGRVEQHDWMRPLRGDWCARLEEVLLSGPGPYVLVAHSLGCHLTAAWAAHSRNHDWVRAALLVAPPNLEQDDVRPYFPTWTPVVRKALPFRATVVASNNDPFDTNHQAASLASAWGAQLVQLGALGHINGDSGLADWPQGHAMLEQLIAP